MVRKLAEIAKDIQAHLSRMEADPAINIKKSGGVSRFFHPTACRSGAAVEITAVSFQGSRRLCRTEAMEYLAWLDAGNSGTVYDFERTRAESR